MSRKIRIIAIVGSTATGKTALSVELAKQLDGEIISCDSMQIYKGMDIGSAKVTETEMRGIPHHMIDIVSPYEDFSCADYAKMAKDKISDISERGKRVIFCGGTGLYLDTVLSGVKLSSAGKDEVYREKLENLDNNTLYGMLCDIDAQSASEVHPNNRKRVIRALEVYHVSGVPKSEWDRISMTGDSPYDTLYIGLEYSDRKKLYDRIDARVEKMFEDGLEDEVRLLDCEAFRKSTSSDGIGYKELLCYFDGRISLSEAKEEIKKNSRNYAKRQMTWFKKNKNINRIYVDECNDGNIFEFIVNSALDIVKKSQFML